MKTIGSVLKPCPFCGAPDPKFRHSGPYPPDIAQMTVIECPSYDCRAQIFRALPPEPVIAAWNLRPERPVSAPPSASPVNHHDIEITAPCGGYGCSQRINDLAEELEDVYSQFHAAKEQIDHLEEFIAHLPAPPIRGRRKPEDVTHGKTCRKEPHLISGGHLHDADDDGPYDVDGVLYCGRCHVAL